ncbi:hypothetical protein [Sphingomonas sp.]|uniref:hypothetical protein n=1 Tax=Sphingomonas sp. TaxID=28214 RepID=UPI0035AF0195
MPAKLKVFRTPIGFHDAYVAAPSQKAALAAWGAEANLFARGQAEVVTDPALTAEPLANPGKVIRKARGSIADHLAALPAAKPSAKAPNKAPAKSARKTPPRPSRKALDAAEAALDEAAQAYAAARAEVEEREAAIRRERRELDREHERTTARLEKSRTQAEAAYRAAMAEWRDG